MDQIVRCLSLFIGRRRLRIEYMEAYVSLDHLGRESIHSTAASRNVMQHFRAFGFLVEDILNLTNFYLQNAPSSTSFGRTTSIYNDLSGNYDPGARVIEFRLRVSF